MLQVVALVLVSVLYITHASSTPAECPPRCKCEAFAILCKDGTVPLMDQRIKFFQLRNAGPPIPQLTPAMTRNMKYLESLHLDSAGLTTLQPNALHLMPHLEDLSLPNNNITKIHNDTFAGCTNLLSLVLDNNNIQVIEKAALAPLHSLQKLSLSHNRLHTLPSPLPPCLQQLSAHHNLLHEAPQLTLHNLTTLNLDQNLITHVDPQQINLKNLRELHLGGSTLTLSARLITHKQFPVLTSLHLRGTADNLMHIDADTLMNIQNMSASSLSTMELDFCRISSLSIFSSNFNRLKTTNVTVMLTERGRHRPQIELPSIVVLDLSGSPGLANAFLGSPSTRIMASLKILRMRWCGITTFPKSFQEQKVPNVTHLDISHNPLRCDCELSWMPDLVRDGKLTLESEKDTLCAEPEYLHNITLLTATLCPIVNPTMTVPGLTVGGMVVSTTHTMARTPLFTAAGTNTLKSTQVSLERSTEPPGNSTKINASHPDSSGTTIEEFTQKQLILTILGGTAVCILLAFTLFIIGRKTNNYYRRRRFSVYRVMYSSPDQLGVNTPEIVL